MVFVSAREAARRVPDIASFPTVPFASAWDDRGLGHTSPTRSQVLKHPKIPPRKPKKCRPKFLITFFPGLKRGVTVDRRASKLFFRAPDIGLGLGPGKKSWEKDLGFLSAPKPEICRLLGPGRGTRPEKV